MKKTTIFTLIIILVLTLSISGCAQNGAKSNDKTIIVGSKPFTEGYILSELIAVMLENNTDLKIERKMGIQGGTSSLQPAILNGDIHIYPEYTGTGWMFVLKKDLINDPEKIYQSVKSSYLTEYDLVWLEPFGFNNTYTLAVKEKFAKENNLETFSQLSQISSQLTFGAEYDFFERDDGYSSLVETYNFQFKKTQEMDIGLKYQAIDQSEVDVINAFSTDGALKKFSLSILKDDKKFFPPYQAAPVIRKDILEKHPQIADILNKLADKIDEETMVNLNYQVDVEKKSAQDVAEAFLLKEGLIK